MSWPRFFIIMITIVIFLPFIAGLLTANSRAVTSHKQIPHPPLLAILFFCQVFNLYYVYKSEIILHIYFASSIGGLQLQI